MSGNTSRDFGDKAVLVKRVTGYVRKYNKFLIVAADNVGSKHMQAIRLGMRPTSVLAMGKNALLKRAFQTVIDEDGRKDLAAVLPVLSGNVGIVFTEGELSDVKDYLDQNTRPAAARAGAISDRDVTVLAGPSGLEPTKTSFLQAVGIASKIAKGQIDIVSDTVLVRAGERVNASCATLLGMLNILPFTYGLSSKYAYDNGSFFDAKVLDITQKDIMDAFSGAIRNVAAVSLAAHYPTAASVPHSFVNSFKALLAVSLATEYTIPAAKDLKDLLNDPEAMARAAAAAASSAGGAAAAAPAEEEKPEEEEEEADFGGGGLFGEEEEDDW